MDYVGGNVDVIAAPREIGRIQNRIGALTLVLKPRFQTRELCAEGERGLLKIRAFAEVRRARQSDSIGPAGRLLHRAVHHCTVFQAEFGQHARE